MLGWTATRLLLEEPSLSVHAAVRSSAALPGKVQSLFGDRVHELDVTDDEARRAFLESVRPDFVLNCVGVIKQDPRVGDLAPTVRINSLLPHLLANDCDALGARLVQVSTDCVFSGRAGSYREEDVPDPVDFYGRSKLLGELETRHLTLRTSIIGPELRRHASLVDWFLSRDGKVVNGFERAIYSGVTTFEFTRFIRDVVLERPELTGLFHLASDPISKYELLKLVAAECGWNGELVPDSDFTCDRSLPPSLKVVTHEAPDRGGDKARNHPTLPADRPHRGDAGPRARPGAHRSELRPRPQPGLFR